RQRFAFIGPPDRQLRGRPRRAWRGARSPTCGIPADRLLLLARSDVARQGFTHRRTNTAALRRRSMQDPFSDRPNDTAVTAIARTIEINLRQLIGNKDLPQPQPPDGFYLM